MARREREPVVKALAGREGLFRIGGGVGLLATRPLAKGTCGKWLVGNTHPTQGRQAAQGSSSRLVCRARARAVHARFLLRSTSVREGSARRHQWKGRISSRRLRCCDATKRYSTYSRKVCLSVGLWGQRSGLCSGVSYSVLVGSAVCFVQCLEHWRVVYR